MTIPNLSNEIAQILIGAENCRDFLLRVFEFKKTRSSGFSYAGFAKKAGFSSKSFARDVICGKKGIGGASCERFIKALQLRGEVAAAFR